MLPNQLKRFRHSLGLSSEAFARGIGLKGNDIGRTVRRWEADPETEGARPPSPMLDTIEAACRQVPGFRDWLVSRGKGR